MPVLTFLAKTLFFSYKTDWGVGTQSQKWFTFGLNICRKIEPSKPRKVLPCTSITGSGAVASSGGVVRGLTDTSVQASSLALQLTGKSCPATLWALANEPRCLKRKIGGVNYQKTFWSLLLNAYGFTCKYQMHVKLSTFPCKISWSYLKTEVN